MALINNEAAVISKIIELPGGNDLTKKCEFLTLEKQWSTSSNLKQPQGLDEGDLCVEFANFLSNLIKLVRIFFFWLIAKILFSRYNILVVLFSQILLVLAIFFSSTFKVIFCSSELYGNTGYVSVTICIGNRMGESKIKD